MCRGAVADGKLSAFNELATDLISLAGLKQSTDRLFEIDAMK